MSVTLQFKLTQAGQTAIWNATNTGVSLNLTHVQVGSGNRAPTGTETALLTPRQAVTIAAGFAVSPTQVRMSAIFTGDLSYTIREVGIWAGDPAVVGSKLVGYWSQATGDLVIKSPGVDFVFTHDMVIDSAVPAGSLTILADTGQSAMLNMIMGHEAKADPHPQYTTDAEVRALIEARVGDYVTATNVGNAYTVALDPVVTAYTNKTEFSFKAAAANTGAVTINAGGGAKNLLREDGTAMVAGDIAAGMVVSVVYDTTLGAFVSTGTVRSQVDARVSALAPSLTGANASGTWGINVTGNSGTSTTLQTARTIGLSGAINGTATSFNGSANITIPTTVTTTQGGIVYGGSPTAYATTAAGTAGQFIMSNGAAAPTWKTLEMSDIPDAAFKKSVRVATTAALTVTATTTALTNATTLAALVLDGITLALNDRVLVKNQAAPAQNGIYTVTNIGSATVAWVLTRATDANTSSKIGAAVVAVDLGTANGGELWTTNFKAADTLGTTAMNWFEMVYNSGTWAISTTGNAATATALATARTINGVSFNGTANITLTAANPTALTFNNAGAGAVSGITHNGSAATTVSYNTIGAAPAASGVPVGAVGHFASAAAPTGWLKANGAAISRTSFAALFAAIGTTYGVGDGSTTFNLPDLRGEFVRGWDDGRGVDAGRLLGSAQADAFRAHNHRFVNEYGTPSTNFVAFSDENREGIDVAVIAGSRSYSRITMENTGSTETRPRNIALLACIKF